ncbi:MAG: hypothetical protein WCD18_26250 [Thermosynechococcaceae cyanobacterium]
MGDPICAIFAPQGAEFKAVRKGLKRCGRLGHTALFPIPIGPQAIQAYLDRWHRSELPRLGHSPAVLVMGLCGSLTPKLNVGDRVLYHTCLDAGVFTSVPPLLCDAALRLTVQERLGNAVTVVTALTCDRMVHRANEKLDLGQCYGAQVVDMEGYAFLKGLQGLGVAVGMLRVVSDDACGDVPDLSAAIAEHGTLKPTALALSLVREPRKGFRLIQGSLAGLKQLEQSVLELFV